MDKEQEIIEKLTEKTNSGEYVWEIVKSYYCSGLFSLYSSDNGNDFISLNLSYNNISIISDHIKMDSNSPLLNLKNSILHQMSENRDKTLKETIDLAWEELNP